jgi:Flp pilus assembly protein TadG
MAGKLRSAFCTRGRRSGGERGQALVEYAIVFPLQLMMTLAIIQLAQIFVAKQVVEYAAFCGARAQLVGLSTGEQNTAALIPISGVCAASSSDGASGILNPFSFDSNPNNPPVPLSGSGTALADTSFPAPQNTLPGVAFSVALNYELRVPVGNAVLYSLGSVGFPSAGLTPDGVGGWYVTLTGQCVLPKPQ